MKVNLACGNVFVEGDDWLNLDFSPVSPSVRQANLLARLPAADASADAVYSSHFLEHIPREEVPGFLLECRRVLRVGGVIRLVTPDLENICRTYLALREAEEYEKADLVVLELVDQCVRRSTGGLLWQALRRLRGAGNAGQPMREFAIQRFGREMLAPIPDQRAVSVNKRWRLAAKASVLQRVRARLQREYIRLWTRGLPKAFRAQNISFATTGERHHWLWDFPQLCSELEKAGFSQVVRRGHASTGIAGFPCDPLDVDPITGGPRKGEQSMFVEATAV